LLGSKINIPYRCIYVIVTFVGACIPLGLVWDIADALNGLMTIPNLIAVLLLGGLIRKETDYYLNGRIDEIDKTPVPLRDIKK
jgi:AGCS family alanine or glycine:cation symporter